jgi:hypothetical protein
MGFKGRKKYIFAVTLCTVVLTKMNLYLGRREIPFVQVMSSRFLWKRKLIDFFYKV